jgi:hypothetical protein
MLVELFKKKLKWWLFEHKKKKECPSYKELFDNVIKLGVMS